MKNEPIIIIGSGMAGCFLALLLAKKGKSVHIIEKRNGIDALMKETGRSFNITLYSRGIASLKKVGLWNEILKFAEVAEGNVAHFNDGTTRFDRFDNSKAVLYTIHRNSLNRVLIQAVKKHPKIKISFNESLISVEKFDKKIIVESTKTGKITTNSYQFLVGADGANSLVRSLMQQGQEANHSLTYSDWGYKEVWIAPDKVAMMNLRKKSTHTWPRDNSLLLAFPNPDSSATLMFNLPNTGNESFETLTSDEKILRYLRKYFPELKSVFQDIVLSLRTRPLGHFITVNTSPWYYKDSIVLIGDAAHALLPFYGQGMCAAFDDAFALTRFLDSSPKNREKAFASYQELRKRNTDILAKLSVENFLELRDKSGSERFVIKDKMYTLLHTLFPKIVLPPLYVLIAHRAISYEEAVRRFKKQELITMLLGVDLILFFTIPVIRILRVLKNFLHKHSFTQIKIQSPLENNL